MVSKPPSEILHDDLFPGFSDLVFSLAIKRALDTDLKVH